MRLAACVHVCALAVLCGGPPGAGAFLPARLVLQPRPQERPCALTMGSETDPRGPARRRLVVSCAVLASTALPTAGRAFFGIGEPFKVFEEEDGTEEGAEDEYPVYGSREIMKKKKHGTSEKPVMKNLKWGCDYELADKICNYNRHFAENAGYFRKTKWLSEVDGNVETTYYDRSRRASSVL
jgi:hypothetical protein